MIKQIKRREFESILKSNGFEKSRTKGSHQMFVRPSDGAVATVCVHKNQQINTRYVNDYIKRYNLCI